ncbi:MAG TPA: type II toxin-antitoxin system RelE/ParE family toxin [Candidatus Thermoplasmatota archaeon]|nr:type II toxin-antitoxin system RelE/ParE family toxin [Candidatus Thermoplasmatota archaeon]
MKLLLDARHAVPVLRALPPAQVRRLKAALRLLGQDASGVTNRLDVKRLDTEAGQPMYRLRVGEWRVAFTVEEAVVVLRIFHRKDGYGWLADME